MRIVSFLIAFALFAVPVEAKDLYVDGSTGNDSTTYAANDSNNPWRTIGRAAWGSTNRNSPNSSEAAQAGDIVYVAEGTYNYSSMHDAGGHLGPPLYEPVNSGTSDNWIVFQGQGNGATLTTSTTGLVQGNGGGIIGASGLGHGSEYIEFDNFILGEDISYSRWGSGLVQIALVDNIKIENCTITGVFASISGNNHPGFYVHGNRSGAGCSSGLRGVEIRNNVIHGFTGNQGTNDAAITMYCVEEFTVDNNEFYGNFTGLNLKNSYNPVGKARSYVRKNIFRDNTKGAEIQTWNNIEFSQNIFKDNTTFGLQFHPGTYYSGEAGSQDVDIVNNTFDNIEAALGWNWLCSQLEDNTFKNNIVTNHGYIIRVLSSECESPTHTGPDDVDHNYNVYEYSGNFYVNDPRNLVSTLSNFKSRYLQGSSQWDDVDCLYENESGDDFRLQTGSPCKEAQANDGIDILDLDGDGSVVDAITIGAYITGNEVIGVGGRIIGGGPSPPSAPTGLSIVDP